MKTGGLRKLLGRVAKRFSRGAVVLAYHRVADLPRDPYNLAVSPANFSQQMEYLKDTCTVMHLSELKEALEKRDLPRRAVALTFDDGYLDVLENACPVMREASLPATLFIPSGLVGEQREFWWDQLERVFLAPEQLPGSLSLTVRGRGYRWDTVSQDQRRSAFWAVYQLIKPLDHETRKQVLDQLGAWAGDGNGCRPGYRMINGEELRQLSREKLIGIGAHTVTHASLSCLSEQEQRQEIVRGREMLEQMIGRPVPEFAYPYGDFTDRTVDILQEANFSLGCTMIGGRHAPSDNPLRLKRCEIQNWPFEIFIRQLESFFVS